MMKAFVLKHDEIRSAAIAMVEVLSMHLLQVFTLLHDMEPGD